MSELLQTDYDQLQAIAGRFGQASQASAEMAQRVQQRMERLRETWLGRGSTAFFAEMEQEVLPATKRLIEALAQAQRATQQIAQTLRTAEEEAAAMFKGSSQGVPTATPEPAAFMASADSSRSNAVAMKGVPASDTSDRVLSKEVRKRWAKLTLAERKAVLQSMADEMAQRDGLKKTTIKFKRLKDAMGEWDDENQVLTMDPRYLRNPEDAIDTVAHEMRHRLQHKMIEELEEREAKGIKRDPIFDSFDRTTREWRDNFNNYISSEDDYDGAYNQPVEVDARRAGRHWREITSIDRLERHIKSAKQTMPATPSPHPRPPRRR